MATREEVLRALRFRDNVTTRDMGAILDYVDQEIAAVPAGTVTVQDEGTPIAGAPHTTLDFVGAEIAATDGGSGVATVTVTVAGGITVEEEGVVVAGGPHSTLNFVGGDITATNAGGGQANITVAVAAPEELVNVSTGARAGVGDLIFSEGFRVDTGSDGFVFGAATNVFTVISAGVGITLPDATLTANSNGSSFSVTCGAGVGTGDGGLLQMFAGTGGTSALGAGGNIVLGGGLAGTASAAAGGDVILLPGRPDGAGSVGSVVIGTVRGDNVAGELRFIEDGASVPTYGSYVGLKARAVVTVASQIYILPEGGQTNNMVLGIDLGEFTVAGLPSASANANCRALATNASGGRTLVRSDGTNWKVVVVEGATVSV